MERLDDYRPLYEQIMAAPEGSELLARYAGTELVQCGDGTSSCTVAVVARGPRGIELTLELVDDEGWTYAAPWHYCPSHRGGPHTHPDADR